MQALNGAATLTDTFTALTEDGTAQQVTITIHAQNDAAVITGDATGCVTEAGGVANGTAGTPTDTGDLDATDVDNPADAWQAVAAGGATANGYGTYALTRGGGVDLYAQRQQCGGAGAERRGDADRHVHRADRGRHRAAGDGHHPRPERRGGDHRRCDGTVTEAGGVANGTAGTPTDTGDLDATDVDNPADAWQAVAAGRDDGERLRHLRAERAGVWTYTLDDSHAAVQALNGSATLTDTFTVLTADGTAQLVTVTINARTTRR